MEMDDEDAEQSQPGGANTTALRNQESYIPHRLCFTVGGTTAPPWPRGQVVKLDSKLLSGDCVCRGCCWNSHHSVLGHQNLDPPGSHTKKISLFDTDTMPAWPAQIYKIQHFGPKTHCTILPPKTTKITHAFLALQQSTTRLLTLSFPHSYYSGKR